jgi:propionyl-CoA synthetase
MSESKADAIITATYGIEPGKQIDYVSIVNQAIELSACKPRFSLVFDRDHATKGDCQLEYANGLEHSHWQLEESAYMTKHGLSFGDQSWATSHPGAPCSWVPSEHPLYILHTSGSTGLPKGIVRQTGGYAVGLSWSTKNVFGIDAMDTMWAASDVGWVLGHSYLIYGPLLRGATTIMFEGKPIGQPDSSVFFRVLAQHNVKTFFCAPTALRAIKREDPDGLLVNKHGLANKLEVAFLAGERCDPDSLIWCKQMLKKVAGGRHIEVLDNWWSTETGWPNCAAAFGLKQRLDPDDQKTPIFPDDKIGSCGIPVPGSNMAVLVPASRNSHDEKESTENSWKEAGPGEMGNIAMRPPLPPGAFRSLSNDPDCSKMTEVYYSRIPGFYDTSDAGFVDADGFYSVMGRIDDVINVAGHRLSTGTMESVLATHSAVAECCVIGVEDELKGHVPLAFVVLKHHALGESEDDIRRELMTSIRSQIGAFAALKAVLIVPRVPKTRSGKILRKCLRQLVDGKPLNVPPTIEDPLALDDIRSVCQSAGLLK